MHYSKSFNAKSVFYKFSSPLFIIPNHARKFHGHIQLIKLHIAQSYITYQCNYLYNENKKTLTQTPKPVVYSGTWCLHQLQCCYHLLSTRLGDSEFWSRIEEQGPQVGEHHRKLSMDRIMCRWEAYHEYSHEAPVSRWTWSQAPAGRKERTHKHVLCPTRLQLYNICNPHNNLTQKGHLSLK